jgi:hypothetical protein
MGDAVISGPSLIALVTRCPSDQSFQSIIPKPKAEEFSRSRHLISRVKAKALLLPGIGEKIRGEELIIGRWLQ